jgi:hypothetical protein
LGKERNRNGIALQGGDGYGSDRGWVYRLHKTGPDFRFVQVGEPMPVKPSDEHKEGFRIRMYNKEIGLREMSSSSKIVRNQMNDLHDAFLAGKADNPGKVPVIEITGSDRIQIETKAQGTQTFRSPKWAIAGWVDRPARLDKAEPATEPAATVAPATVYPFSS